MHSFFRVLRTAAVILLAALFLSACSSSPSGLPASLPAQSPSVADSPSAQGTQVALLTTEDRLAGTFGQEVWTAVARFAGEAGLSANIYKVEKDAEGAALNTLELAVRNGAKMVVCTDAAVTGVVQSALWQYPETYFLLLDSPDTGAALPPNAAGALPSPLQTGWLAGYVAAHERQTGNLGLLLAGDTLSQQTQLGFVLGAEAAAEAQQLAPNSLVLAQAQPNLPTQPPFPAEEQDTLRTFVGDLYRLGGVEIMFSAVPAWQSELLSGTREAQAKMIGTDLVMDTTGQAGLASIVFQPKGLIARILQGWQQNSFPGGSWHYGTVADGDILFEYDELRLQHNGEELFAGASALLEGGTLETQLEILTTEEQNGRRTLNPQALNYIVFGLSLDEGHLPATTSGTSVPSSSSTSQA